MRGLHYAHTCVRCALCTNNTAYIIMLHPLINRSNINRDNRDNAVAVRFELRPLDPED